MKKIGHTGTLDPAAEGVLPVALGKGTRLVELLTEKEKTYEAVLRLGVSTDTQDMTGAVLSEKPVTVTEEEVREAVGSFVGKQQQIPPMYSALKVNGKKLYELAREGKTIERKPRPVVFYEIRILDMELPLVRISVTCSKGTYIRTLCNDIGEKLGCGGAMEELLRTRSGNFTLEESIHRGHQKLVEKILEQKEKGLQTVLFSLGIGSQMIFTKEERCQLLEKAGVDVLIECPLDNRIRHMKAETFVKEILVGDLQAEHVAVGEDFRFGYERKGTPQLLETMGRKLGFTVDVVPKEMEGRRKISSTFIREELKKGNMEKVNDLLGIPFFVDGVIEHGRGMGHKVLLPTTNIVPAKEKLMPPNGVYDTVSHFKDRTLCGITNVGYKPTIGEKFLGVETYLFDCEEDLYGEPCRVEFFHYSRPEKRFSSIEALKQQLLKDAEKGKAYFRSLEK